MQLKFLFLLLGHFVEVKMRFEKKLKFARGLLLYRVQLDCIEYCNFFDFKNSSWRRPMDFIDCVGRFFRFSLRVGISSSSCDDVIIYVVVSCAAAAIDEILDKHTMLKGYFIDRTIA